MTHFNPSIDQAAVRRVAFLARAFALLALAGGVEAATLTPTHFAARAEGASAVRFEIGGKGTEALDYKAFAPAVTVAGGAVVVRAIDTDGNVLATRTFTLGADERGVVILAGNGSDELPYALTWSPDHNAPLHADEFTDQVVHVAPLGGAARVSARLSCGRFVEATTLRYGAGTIDAGTAAQRSHRGAGALSPCTWTLTGEGVDAETRFTPVAASRVRLFAIGDGENRPFEAYAWLQGTESPVAVIEPGAGVEGLWYDPSTPGLGVSIAYDPEAPANARVQAIFYGVGRDGRATWNLVAAEQGITRGVAVYAFATPSPTSLTRNATRVPLTTSGSIEFHSCDTATLRLGNQADSAFYALVAPRDTIRLVKLLPGPGCSNPGLG